MRGVTTGRDICPPLPSPNMVLLPLLCDDYTRFIIKALRYKLLATSGRRRKKRDPIIYAFSQLLLPIQRPICSQRYTKPICNQPSGHAHPRKTIGTTDRPQVSTNAADAAKFVEYCSFFVIVEIPSNNSWFRILIRDQHRNRMVCCQ